MKKYAIGTRFLSSSTPLTLWGSDIANKSNQEIADLLKNAKEILIFDDLPSAFNFCASHIEKIPNDEQYGHAYNAEFIAPVFVINLDESVNLGEKKSIETSSNDQKESISYYVSTYSSAIKILEAKFSNNRANRQDIDFSKVQNTSSWQCIIT